MRPNSPRFLALFVLEISCAAGLAPLRLYAQSCGDEIKVDTTLTADIGPCPNNGLVVIGTGTSLTLNLNGFTISGSGGGVGVSLPHLSSGVITIQGPGTITNFDLGIAGGNSNTIIQNLTLASNGGGISMSRSASVRIINNTIDGCPRGDETKDVEIRGTDGCLRGFVGISIDETKDVQIRGNVIKGHNQGLGVGISVGFLSGGTEIFQNNVKKNTTGLSANAAKEFCITIVGNNLSKNTLDGAVITSGKTTVWLNTSNGNGRDGIVFAGALNSQGNSLIQDNVADENGNRGIALANIPVGASALISDNEALGNALDLFWDRTAGDTCWEFNRFLTSDPPTLPKLRCDALMN